ncbi:DUF4747 family protein [Maricaulis sp.]|uniref:DUF4747 family protein n=1 Tax=Maricaulis sp. TaxID=1486257 RepID=UPI003A8DA588
MRTIEVQALNVRIFPHPEDSYKYLLQRIYNTRTPIKVYGNTFIAITSLNQNDDSFARGMISRFTNIESDNWFDALQFEESEDGPTIPAHLFANHKSFRFVFDYELHLFVFESYDGSDRLSWRFVDKYLRTMSENGAVIRGSDHVEVDLVKDQHSIDELFSFERLSTVNITINKPNPDLAHPDRRERFRDRMEHIQARQLKFNYAAPASSSIQPDDELIEEAEVARTDGKIVTSGYGPDGVKREKSSADFPMSERSRYDAKQIAPEQAFLRQAGEFLAKVRAHIQNATDG